MSYPNHQSYDPRNWKRTLLAAQWQIKMDIPDISTFHADAQCFAVDDPVQHTVAHQHEPIHYSTPEWAPVHPLPGHGMAGPWYVSNGGLNSPQPRLPAGGSFHQAAPLANGSVCAQVGPAIPYYSSCVTAQPQYGVIQMLGQPIASLSMRGATTRGRTSARYAHYEQRPRRPEDTVTGVAGDREGFEGDTLNRLNLTSRMSARRDDPASGLIPESVKAAGQGQTRRKAISRAPRVDKRQTPYLSSCWNCDHCESGFGRVHELRRHWRSASVHVRPSLTCDECENDKTFSRPDALLAHKRTFHGWL